MYFTDVGLLCYLAGLKDPEHAAAGPMGGAIFETAVFTELYKTLLHRGQEAQIYFWRTSAGTEVDFVLEVEGKLLPVEVKTIGTPRPQQAKNIMGFRKDFSARSLPGFVVHPGDSRLPLGKGVMALPFGDL